jgi:signal transduction histidine kinase
MTLAQHFLVVSIFPLSFLGLLIYLWRSRGQQPATRARWAYTLLLAAFWSSVILRFHSGQALTAELIYGWGILANYLFSLTAFGLLLTTVSYLDIRRSQQLPAVILTLTLIAAALLLDVHLWGFYLTGLSLIGQPVNQFDLWISVWIASWWLAAFTALLMTLQKRANSPNSLFRNQTNYWLIVLILFLVGGIFTSIQQHNRPIWQEIGVLFALPAAIIGTISVARSQLPDLQLTVRRLLNRLSGTLIIFGLIWVVLFFLTEGLADLPPGLSHNLVLVLAALLFAVFFTWVYRSVNDLTRRIFLPVLARQELVLADYTNAAGNLPEPAELGRLLLRRIESNLTTVDGCCFLAEEGPGGRLLLRPLTTLTAPLPQTVGFAAGSPFVAYLRRSTTPIRQYDIDNLARFQNMDSEERQALTNWQKIVYLPLPAGDSLIGMIALDEKENGEAYDEEDFTWLEVLANQISPVLAQACHLASLRQINDYVFDQNQALARSQHHLQAILSLQNEFINLISPDLRRPLLEMERQVKELETDEAVAAHPAVRQIGQQVHTLRSPVEALIHVAGRIQKREEFQFQPIHPDAIIRSTLRNLRTMAQARRIRVDYNITKPIPDIYGDEVQLREAVQNLLHNAIKFNKIGGLVKIDCLVEDGQLCLRVADTGVGIREDRLPYIWSGFEQLQMNGNGSQRSSGLGLTLAQFIVKAHGGRIDVESSYGSGSTFTIYLPLKLVE